MSCSVEAGVAPLEEIAVHRPGHSVRNHDVRQLHYVNPSSSLVAAMQVKKGSSMKLSLRLNQASLGVVNSMALQASFPVQRRPVRRVLSVNSDDFPSHAELLEWAAELKIQLGTLIPTKADELRVLQLLYSYRHLNGTNLDSLPATDLIVHRARLTPGTKPSSEGAQFRLAPHKEWWLRKLVQDGMSGGIYERTQHANGRLSAWNARPVIVDKEENPKPTDEPRITFDYSKVKEDMPGSHLELMSKVHDYLSDPRHRTFFQADVKHGYFSVVLHPDDRHLFAFSIPGIGQLQPTRMPQGSKSAGFTMSELMNIALGPIPEPYPESSLMHGEAADAASIAFYMDDLFSGHPDFESQFVFL